MTSDLPVDVVVDAETGEWSVDGIPMILVPRHFWVAIHRETEAKLGVEGNAKVLHDASYWAAYQWCEKEAKTHGLSGAAVFEHYMKRLSQRGWGQITIEELDPQAGRAVLRVEHSVFVSEFGRDADRKVCYMFNGCIRGGLEFAAKDAGYQVEVSSREVECASDGADICRFEVGPIE